MIKENSTQLWYFPGRVYHEGLFFVEEINHAMSSKLLFLSFLVDPTKSRIIILLPSPSESAIPSPPSPPRFQEVNFPNRKGEGGKPPQ